LVPQADSYNVSVETIQAIARHPFKFFVEIAIYLIRPHPKFAC